MVLITSPLNEISRFHVPNNQLPQDVMHIILEGTLPLEIKLMLTSFIRTDVQFLNDCVSKFYYGETESRNKPPKEFTIKSFCTDGILHLSASKMHTIYYDTLSINLNLC